MEESKRKLILKIMLILSLIGLAVTSYQTYEHYFLTSSICDISTLVSCSVVTESRFGEFPPNSGIATAAYGIFWWGALVGFIYGSLRKKEWEFYTLLWLLAGLLVVFYLLVIEFYILPLENEMIVICLFCTIQHIIIFTVLILSFITLKKPIKTYLENMLYVEK